ncbi:MAG: antitermination protein NusA [Acidobacteria bacterium]|nr:MAG: antitermination protein NusA [Acidobacteriota bacterium]PIE91423.1 MAG: antitermination protein NusA [Acidobacteriota bacterium]
MGTELLNAIEQVHREKNIEPEVLITAIEDALIAASKKIFKSDEDFGAKFNRTTGDIEVWAIKVVVDEVENPRKEISLEEASLYYEGVEVGYEIEFQRDTTKLGRIAAHTAKQVILQKVRDAEKRNVFLEYSDRIGKVVMATVRRRERGDVILELDDGTECVMKKDEQSRSDYYKANDRIRVVIVKVDENSKDPQVKVSRSSGILLMRLFEMEVPEIYDQTVMLKNAAREAGDRSKIAVFSNDPDVDPIGACVGIGGQRVKSIIRELKGEKLDIVRYSDDIATYTANALSPAKINRVIVVDPFTKELEVIVDQDQYSIAIGKRGQNVRLASKLTGWSLVVKTEEQKLEEVTEQMSRMAEDSSRERAAIESELEETVEEKLLVEEDLLEEDVEESTETMEEDGVPIDFLEGLSEEHKQILEAYDIRFIEDLLYTDRDVLMQIPELVNDINGIIELAEAYAAQFSDEEEA